MAGVLRMASSFGQPTRKVSLLPCITWRFVLGARFEGEHGAHGAVPNAVVNGDNGDGYGALEKGTIAPLNLEGRRSFGFAGCPRAWFIHTGRPPHMSQLTWDGITPAMRGLHIACFRGLRAMPEELLAFDLQQAVVELVWRQSLARPLKWSTISKRLSAMAGALRDLALYTNRTEGVNLRQCPEWVAATKPVREMDVEYARVKLECKPPEASLMLQLMWMLAARASDVTTLQRRDIRLADKPNAQGRYPLVVKMRCGKGAKLGGAYNATLSLSRTDASSLAKLLTQRRSKQVVFRQNGDLCTMIRSALREQEPGSALPSIRKGALRMLANGGTSSAMLMWLAGHELGGAIVANLWTVISAERHVTYNYRGDDFVVYTDASVSGWGALVQRNSDGLVTVVQQGWIHDNLLLMEQRVHGTHPHDDDDPPRPNHTIGFYCRPPTLYCIYL